MKLLRYGPPGQERPGLIDEDGVLRDLSAKVDDISAQTLAPTVLDTLRKLEPARLPLVPGGQRLGPPVAAPGNILCIGLNYGAHADEAGMPRPTEPIVLSKHTSALSGPNDPVRLPAGSERTDWEVELAAVIGRAASSVSESDALNYVAGYTVCNDVSERHFQLDRGGQWMKGKSCDTFCPLGPILVTADEIPDPQRLRLWLSLNGDTVQDSTTSDMIFSVAEIISYLSHFMTLRPGDVITTGTPQGVGMGRGFYLKKGDVMRMGIDSIGEMEQHVV